MVNKTFLLLIVNLFIGGCFGDYSIRNIDKPVPDYYQLWEKVGSNQLDIKKKLLECGGNNPAGDMTSMNAAALTYMCMVQAGYFPLSSVNGSRKNIDSWCINWPDLPACQPGAEIPTPRIERRLNSHYCKSAMNYQFCKDTTRNPAACERMDFDNPPLECLP